jgi:tripartite-type tricarboxylate transporter receptor subunit TctC
MKLLAIAFGLLVASMTNAMAQAYPSRPITIIVPFPAGGPTDTLARILADHMSASLAQSVIIENVSGGDGKHWGGAGRASGCRRLYAQYRSLEHACRERRDHEPRL